MPVIMQDGAIIVPRGNPPGVEDVSIEVSPEPDDYLCPKCGKSMRMKRNSITGKSFFGCDGWPGCNETRDADEKGEPLASNFGRERGPIVRRSGKRSPAAKPEPLTVWERLMDDDD